MFEKGLHYDSISCHPSFKLSPTVSCLSNYPIIAIKVLKNSLNRVYEKGLDNAGQFSPAELIFELVCAEVDSYGAQKVNIVADGLLEILSDGFGFLRSLCPTSQLGADDVYVSPAQIRRFNCRLEVGFKVSPEHQKTMSVTLRCFVLSRSTVVHLRMKTSFDL